VTRLRINALALCLLVAGLAGPHVRNSTTPPANSPSQVRHAETRPVANSRDDTYEADRLNNRGVGYMNQQQFEKAESLFRAAYAKNPKLKIAWLNEGIALLNAQQVDEAQKILLAVTQVDPDSARAWYNLGLLYKSRGATESALRTFEKVAKIDPKDADTQYFRGSLYLQLKQFPQAIAAFEEALRLNPYHASAQFGLARAYQQSGDRPNAREHLARFQQITGSKLGVPMSVAYGEQGPYSLAATSSSTVETVLPTIPVRFMQTTAEAGMPTSVPNVTSQHGSDASGLLGSGACLFDYDNDGRPDLFVTAWGRQGGVALYHNVGNGRFQDVTASVGLDPKTPAIGCAAGDYDNEGFTDLAVSYETGLVLYHKEKGQKLRDVTQASGIRTDGHVLGVTFVDYDHDGDLDLYVTRGTNSQTMASIDLAQTGQRGDGNVLWRNNGNGTFTDVTEAT